MTRQSVIFYSHRRVILRRYDEGYLDVIEFEKNILHLMIISQSAGSDFEFDGQKGGAGPSIVAITIL